MDQGFWWLLVASSAAQDPAHAPSHPHGAGSSLGLEQDNPSLALFRFAIRVGVGGMSNYPPPYAQLLKTPLSTHHTFKASHLSPSFPVQASSLIQLSNSDTHSWSIHAKSDINLPPQPPFYQYILESNSQSCQVQTQSTVNESRRPRAFCYSSYIPQHLNHSTHTSST